MCDYDDDEDDDDDDEDDEDEMMAMGCKDDAEPLPQDI